MNLSEILRGFKKGKKTENDLKHCQTVDPHARAPQVPRGLLGCSSTNFSHIFFCSHFKILTSTLYEKKNAVYCSPISLFFPEIFKFLKYAN